MKQVTWVILAMFAMACLGTTGNADEYEVRAQVIAGEINNVDQMIAEREKGKINLQNEINQLRAEKLKRVGALEELARMKEIADRNAELEEMQTNRREERERREDAKTITEIALIEEVQE